MYWTRHGPVCFDCITAVRTQVTGDVIALLQILDRWTTAAALARRHPEMGPARGVTALLEALAARGLVQRGSLARDEWPWSDWAPEAAFFHFGTRIETGTIAPAEYDARLRLKAVSHPQPAPTKSLSGHRLALPRTAIDGSLGDALAARRTWRQFSRQPIALERLAALLQTTFGVQHWGVVRGQGRIALKTSPSGGARHALEAYVIAQNVAGLPRGVYHYDAAAHELVKIGARVSRARLAHVLANQRWFLDAGAVVVMAAVFERAMWRYPYSRAYRSILTEAGHLGQTFCLVATALGLAPFCTMAFRDRELEDLIGVDGIGESAMYIVGVGTRPRGRVINPGKIPRRLAR